MEKRGDFPTSARADKINRGHTGALMRLIACVSPVTPSVIDFQEEREDNKNNRLLMPAIFMLHIQL